jgi:hypothetical protein
MNDALQILERTGERWFAAELNRHRGGFAGNRGRIRVALLTIGLAASFLVGCVAPPTSGGNCDAEFGGEAIKPGSGPGGGETVFRAQLIRP